MKPNLARQFNNRGNAYLFKKDDDRAIQDYDEAILLGPNEPEAFNGRGLIHLIKKDYSRAILNYDRAILLAPDYAKSLYGRGLAESANGDTEKSSADIAATKRIDPNVGDVFTTYGFRP